MQPLPYGLQRRIKEAKNCAFCLDEFLQSACLYCNFLVHDKKQKREDVRKYKKLLKKFENFECVKKTIKFLNEIDDVLQISSTDTDAVIHRLLPKARTMGENEGYTV